MPPFSLQPLVENAVQHGLHSSPQAGRLQLAVGVTGQWLEISVSDDGQGVPSTGVEQLFFAERPRVHALALLRRRLQGLFGRSFQLEVRSEIGEGTTVTMRIPLRELSPRSSVNWHQTESEQILLSRQPGGRLRQFGEKGHGLSNNSVHWRRGHLEGS